MSYDLMVFDPSTAPRTREKFIFWFDQHTRWTETHGYNDPSVCTPALRAWFDDMVKTFPPMNGPQASADPDDPHVTDYSLGKQIIYAAFGWSVANMAHIHVRALAERHRVGFFDVSSTNGEIWLPTANGGFEKMRG